MAKKSLTSNAAKVNFSLEYIRKGQSGLELVKVQNGKETVTPVQVTTKGSTRKRLVISYEPRFVNGELRVF